MLQKEMIEEEQRDTLVSPSIDIFFEKSIRHANYNFESMIDMYSDLRGFFLLSQNYVNLFEFRKALEEQKMKKFFRSCIFESYL